MAFVPLELRDLSGGVEEEQSTSFIEGGLKTLPGHPWTPHVIKHWSSYLSEMMASSAMFIKSCTDHQNQTSFECCSQHQSGDDDCSKNLSATLIVTSLEVSVVDKEMLGRLVRRNKKNIVQLVFNINIVKENIQVAVCSMWTVVLLCSKLYLSDPASGYNKGQLILTQTVHALQW